MPHTPHGLILGKFPEHLGAFLVVGIILFQVPVDKWRLYSPGTQISFWGVVQLNKNKDFSFHLAVDGMVGFDGGSVLQVNANGSLHVQYDMDNEGAADDDDKEGAGGAV